MKKTINGYEITNGTAIAVGIGNGVKDRQPALFIHKLDDENKDGDFVFFDCDTLPQDEKELKSIFDCVEYQSSYYEDLETFAEDGELRKEYHLCEVSGEGKDIHSACFEGDTDPVTLAIFPTWDTAKKTLENYRCEAISYKHLRNGIKFYKAYFVEEWRVDEDGEFIDGGDYEIADMEEEN